MSRVSLNDYYYDTQNKIGRGSSGVVYLGYHHQTRDKVAIKRVDINNLADKMTKIWNEIHIMKEMDHPNVVTLYDVYIDIKNEYLYLIMEYCEGSDLSDYIQDYLLDLGQIHQFISQLRDGLFYLHQKGIVHRDLKPHNLLLKNDTTNATNNVIKIADFGLSTNNNNGSLMQTMCGSPLYMSPEIIEHQKYTAKSDLWSIGIIIYQLIYHQHPFQDCRNFAELTQKIKSEPIRYPKKPALDNLTMDLLEGLLNKNPHNRMNWQDFFNHPWFSHNPSSNLLNNSLSDDDNLSSNIDSTTESSEYPDVIIKIIDSADDIFKMSSSVDRLTSKGSQLDLSQYVVENYQKSDRPQSKNIPISRSVAIPINIKNKHITTPTTIYGTSAPSQQTNNSLYYSPGNLNFNSMGSSLVKYISNSYSWIRSSIDF